MSQEKVEHKKELKKNRKKIVKKNRFKNIIFSVVIIAIIAAIGVWVGYSIYGKYESYAAENVTSTPVSLDSLTGYLSDYLQADTAAE